MTDNLTFSQAQGLEPLPSQARLKWISKETIAALWSVIHDWLKEEPSRSYGYPSRAAEACVKRWWVNAKHEMIDEAPNKAEKWRALFKSELLGGYARAFDLVQFLIRDAGFDKKRSLQYALVSTRAAYRIVDDRVVPFASQEEHAQLVAAVDASKAIGAAGARTHLLNAGSFLTAGQWASAISEAIAAVESAARLVSGQHSKELGPILVKLREDGVIKHAALAQALKQIYGYTSDEQGIRHSLVLADKANVNEGDAFLMLGLCASFVTYLLALPRST